MKRNPILIGALALAVGALGGCSALPDDASTRSAPSTSPDGSSTASTVPAAASTTSAPSRLLSCADLVTEEQIRAAVHGPNSPADPVITRISTAEGDEALLGVSNALLGEKAIQGAGGLTCAWRVGPASPHSPVFEASVLPGAAPDWTGYLYGDGPTPQRRTFLGFSAAAACGDPGCGASATVGSSWVRVDLLEPDGGEQTGRGVFGHESEDTIYAHAKPAVESVFRSVRDASAARLRFPSHLKADPNTRCEDLVAPAALAKAMGVRAVHYDTRYQFTPEQYGIAGAALTRMKAKNCDADASTTSADLVILPKQAWAIDDLMSDPPQRGDLEPTTLRGQRAGEHALTDCGTTGNATCEVVLSLADFAVLVDDSSRSLAIAEAVVAAYHA